MPLEIKVMTFKKIAQHFSAKNMITGGAFISSRLELNRRPKTLPPKGLPLEPPWEERKPHSLPGVYGFYFGR